MFFIGSPALQTIRIKGDYRITKQVGHEDYSVWRDGRIIAQGGFRLIEQVFKEKS